MMNANRSIVGNEKEMEMSLSQMARDAFDFCNENAKPSTSCDGKRAVFMDWRGLAERCGLSDCDHGNMKAMLAALQELHEARLLSYFDHGPACYGHTSTIVNPVVIVRVRGKGGNGLALFPADEWKGKAPVGKVLAVHEARRDITEGEPFEIIAETRI